MNPKRKQRLYLTVFLLMVSAGVTGLLILVSGENMNMFYPPADVVAGKIPPDQKVRAGGMVLDGSVQRSDTSLAVDFQLTDHQGAVFAVAYAGILPDLFREGQGILVEGEDGCTRECSRQRRCWQSTMRITCRQNCWIWICRRDLSAI